MQKVIITKFGSQSEMSCDILLQPETQRNNKMRSGSISATGSRCSPRGLTPQHRRSLRSLHHRHSTLNINKRIAMST